MKFRTHNKKKGAAALITAAILALVFTGCPNNAGGSGSGSATPPTKYAITFSVDSTTPNGTLKAKADGVPETEASPITVEEGKTVTFTATANDGYRVKGWTLDGKPITEAGTNTEYKLKVSKPATVKVSFEAKPPTKYTVTLTQTEHGKVTASPEIPEDKKVDKDTVITFTATADDGYKVGKWTVTGSVLEGSTGADGSPTAKVKITADTTVSVSFTKKTYAVNFSVAGTGGTLKAEGDGITQPATSPITVEHGKEVIFTATADDGYKVGKWTVTGSVLEGSTGADGSPTAKVKITADTSVTVSFELIPQAILTLSPDHLTIEVKAKTADGSAITVRGCNETTLASDVKTTLTATGTTVILDGNITELTCGSNQLTALKVQGLTALQKLECSVNQLTALNVQGLTALQELWCSGNQLPELNVQGLTALKELICYLNKLNADAFIKIFNDLPTREASDGAAAVLYKDRTVYEDNCTDFSTPESLKKAFENAKNIKHWKLQKMAGYIEEDI